MWERAEGAGGFLEFTRNNLFCIDKINYLRIYIVVEKKKAGRPKGSISPKLKLKPEDEKRVVQKQFRFTLEEFLQIQRAAEFESITVSKLIRDATLEKSDEIIKKKNNTVD